MPTDHARPAPTADADAFDNRFQRRRWAGLVLTTAALVTATAYFSQSPTGVDPAFRTESESLAADGRTVPNALPLP